jgi:hypothetical protein
MSHFGESLAISKHIGVDGQFNCHTTTFFVHPEIVAYARITYSNTTKDEIARVRADLVNYC